MTTTNPTRRRPTRRRPVVARRSRRTTAAVPPADGSPPSVVLVGPSTRFLSGIAAYTYCLAGGLAGHVDLSVLLIRRLVPQRLYPGGARVGRPLSAAELPQVPTFDGIDWYWGASAVRMLQWLRREEPQVMLLQWWTGTVLHTYLLLALACRVSRRPLVIEFHESLDPGEQSLPLLAHYVRLVAPRLFRSCAAYIVHSEHDRAALTERYRLDPAKVHVVPHAVYSHTRGGTSRREAPEDAVNLLFFGLIRPVKGLDVLLDAVDSLAEPERSRYWLTIVGETWEGCEPIVERARRGPFADRTTVVNRYVSDEEAGGWMAGADAVVLPYRSSSQSGVFHMAMAYGLPAVVSAVGGLSEAAAAYPRAVLVQPSSSAALLDGIRQVPVAAEFPLLGAGQGWDDSGRAIATVVAGLGALRSGRPSRAVHQC